MIVLAACYEVLPRGSAFLVRPPMRSGSRDECISTTTRSLPRSADAEVGPIRSLITMGANPVLEAIAVGLSVPWTSLSVFGRSTGCSIGTVTGSSRLQPRADSCFIRDPYRWRPKTPRSYPRRIRAAIDIPHRDLTQARRCKSTGGWSSSIVASCGISRAVPNRNAWVSAYSGSTPPIWCSSKCPISCEILSRCRSPDRPRV